MNHPCFFAVASRLAVAFFASTLAVAATSRASGGIDPSFGSAGKVLTSFLGARAARVAAAAPDGRIVVAGDGVDEFAALVRYRSDGSLDPTFGAGGRVLTGFQGARGVRAVVVQPDGNVIVAGDGGDEFAAVVRYRVDGSLDSTFGSGGRVLTGFQGAHGVRAAVLQPDGKLVVVGEGTEDFAALVRYQRDGSLDPTFGSGGRVLTAFQGAVRARAAAVAPDGTVVVAGDGDDEFAALVRYQDDGSLDSTFGNGGRVLIASEGARDVHAVVVQPDGRVVVVGDGLDDFAALVRVTTDGTLDPSFGSGGRVLTAFQGATAARAAVGQPDGTLTVVGDAVQDFAAVVRYRGNGTLDSAFGSGGRTLTAFPGAGLPQAIVAGGAGVVVIGDGEFAALARYVASTTAARPGVPATSTGGIAGPGTAPVGCPGGTSPTAIRCRADLLTSAVQTSIPQGAVHDAVMAMLSAARARTEIAATQASARVARADLRVARQLLAYAAGRLRTRRAAMLAPVREVLLARLAALRADLRALSRTM